MAKAAKDKKDGQNGLKTWQDVDAAYKQYAQKDANVTYITSILNSERAQREELGAAITAFVEAHTADLGPNKKKLLESGQIGLSKSSSAKSSDEAFTLDYLKKNHLENCYKVKETLDRKALAALGPDVMAAAKVEIVTEYKVSLKPNPRTPNCNLQFM